MRSRYRLIIIFLLVLIAAGAFAVFNYQSTHRVVYSLEFVKTSGEEFSLGDFKGRVILLELMSTSCPVCSQEITYLQKVASRYSREQVEIVSVSVDLLNDTPSVLKSYALDKDITWTLARDIGGLSVNAFQVSELPTIVVIDKEGLAQLVLVSLVDDNILCNIIDEILA